jgi:hypothetical protein
MNPDQTPWPKNLWKFLMGRTSKFRGMRNRRVTTPEKNFFARRESALGYNSQMRFKAAQCSRTFTHSLESSGSLAHFYILFGEDYRAILLDWLAQLWTKLWYIRLPPQRREFCEQLSQARKLGRVPDDDPWYPCMPGRLALVAPQCERESRPAAMLLASNWRFSTTLTSAQCRS